MSVLRTGSTLEEHGWMRWGILLCDFCGRRSELEAGMIDEAFMFGGWTSYRLRNEAGDEIEEDACPECRR